MVPGELWRSLEALLPAIRERRAEIEQARCLPRDLVDALCATGLFRMPIPRDLGGMEAEPEDILRAIEWVASADGSTGWCAMVGVANNLVAGYMNARGAKEVFADPSRPSAGIAAPAGVAMRVDGGVRVRGRWPYASGITHSPWVWAGCTVMEDTKPHLTPTGPEVVHVCVPADKLQILDTWFVSGLCGTGSHDVVAGDLFVPDDRVFLLFDPTAHRHEALYQMPVMGWYVSQVAAVSLGIARAALDELAVVAQTKVPTLSPAVLADRPVAQVEVARAEAALEGARASLYATVEDLRQTLRAGKTPTPRQRALNRSVAVSVAEVGASVARSAHVMAGGSSLFTGSDLQRHMRDADALAHHFTVAPHVWEDAGRIFLGREPTTPLF